MCRSMVDIQSVTAEIGKEKKKKRNKEERRKKPQDKNIMSASATQDGHNYLILQTTKTELEIIAQLWCSKSLLFLI